MTWGQLNNDMASRSMFGAQTLRVLEPWWTVRIELDALNEFDADDLLVFAMSLKGQQNQLSLWNVARPAPLGTMRGSPVLSNAHTANESVLRITGGTANGTLRKGDMLGIGSGLTQRLFMVQAAITLNGSGAGTVSVLPGLDNDFAISTPVVWDKPKCLFRRTENRTEWTYETIMVSGLSMEFVEDPRS